jgi:ureidoacrylate peracid hydrolase
MQITIPAKPEPVKIDTKKTALIVVDMQNGFCKKGGMIDVLKGMDEQKANRAIQTDKKVIDVCRRNGIPIIYLRMIYQPDLSNTGGPDSPNYWKESAAVAMRTRPEYKGKFLTDGTWDGDIAVELRPQPEDLVIDKCRFSGFRKTNLDSTLKGLGIKHLLFIGIATNVCVESTIRDAFFQDYFPLMISDACCTFGPDFLQKATEWNVTNLFGWVTTSEDLSSAF